MIPKYTFPADYGQDCVLVEIDRALVPLVAGALKRFEAREAWATTVDYEQGYNAFAQLRLDLMGKCVEQITRAIYFSMGYPRDVELAPDGFPVVELPEADLFSIRKHIADPGDGTLYGQLAELLTAAQASQLSEAEAAELLGRIAPIIAGVIAA